MLQDRCASGLTLNACFPRPTAVRTRAGLAVHTKRLGLALVSAMKRLMASCRSATERKTPRLRRRVVSLAKKPSTALSQDAEVGVRPSNVKAGSLTTDFEVFLRARLDHDFRRRIFRQHEVNRDPNGDLCLILIACVAGIAGPASRSCRRSSARGGSTLAGFDRLAAGGLWSPTRGTSSVDTAFATVALTRRAASLRPGPSANLNRHSGSRTPTVRQSPTPNFRRDENEAGKRTCSPTMRPGGSPPTSPNCQSSCPTRARNDYRTPRDRRRRRPAELAGDEVPRVWPRLIDHAVLGNSIDKQESTKKSEGWPLPACLST